jgi:anthranilate phosphoribosyltransferase
VKEFGKTIAKLIDGRDISYDETFDCFRQIIEDRQTDMQQGAFLAAITAKGAAGDEIRAIMDCILEFDTNEARPRTAGPVVECSGTGMDSVKTFNISTAASLVACACGAVIARHASRGLTSACGAIDLIEGLGVDVEAPVGVIKDSIERVGVGVFNGGSANVHPKALSRILSRISFGSVLNTAASLANPARPVHGVRGVNAGKMVAPFAEVMRDVGYKRAIVVHGLQSDGSDGMDEAGTIGETVYAELWENGAITEGSFAPEDFGLSRTKPDSLLSSGCVKTECERLRAIIEGQGSAAENECVALNSALILYVAGISPSIKDGIERSLDVIKSGRAVLKLLQWVDTQNSLGLPARNRLAEKQGISL